MKTRKLATDSRPTTKAGVPHLIACDGVLRRMLTLRIHLDEVTDENGPLRLIPGSHISSAGSAEATRRHRRILHLDFAAGQTLPVGVAWHGFVSAESHGWEPRLKDGIRDQNPDADETAIQRLLLESVKLMRKIQNRGVPKA